MRSFSYEIGLESCAPLALSVFSWLAPDSDDSAACIMVSLALLLDLNCQFRLLLLKAALSLSGVKFKLEASSTIFLNMLFW